MTASALELLELPEGFYWFNDGGKTIFTSDFYDRKPHSFIMKNFPSGNVARMLVVWHGKDDNKIFIESLKQMKIEMRNLNLEEPRSLNTY